MRDVGLACPDCRADLALENGAFACVSCGNSYPVIEGIPILLSGSDRASSSTQARWFDEAVDIEWEIERPHGGPYLHRWLLSEKFRRSVSHLDLHGLTALAVCAGSGMDAEFLVRSGARVISSDISLGAARRARERALRHAIPLEVMVADVERLPLADRSIDIVYVHDGLHHLERPLDGLAEMARVARLAVCVTEPTRAALTTLAVRLGVALEREEAGNRVARLGIDEVRSTLAAGGFRVVRAERYGMYYRHEPGRVVRLLSRQPLLALSQAWLGVANSMAGRLGNKLTVQAVRGRRGADPSNGR